MAQKNKSRYCNLLLLLKVCGAAFLFSVGCSSLKNTPGKKNTLPVTYLIPEGFEGMTRIIWDQPCGTAPRVEEGRQIVELPANGLLVMQSKEPLYAFKGALFYFKDNAGNKKQIKQIIDNNPSFFVNKDGTRNYSYQGNTTLSGRDGTSPAVVMGMPGVHSLGLLDNVNSNPGKNKKASVYYHSFFVYNKKQIDSTDFKENAARYIATDNLAKDCLAKVVRLKTAGKNEKVDPCNSTITYRIEKLITVNNGIETAESTTADLTIDVSKQKMVIKFLESRKMQTMFLQVDNCTLTPGMKSGRAMYTIKESNGSSSTTIVKVEANDGTASITISSPEKPGGMAATAAYWEAVSGTEYAIIQKVEDIPFGIPSTVNNLRWETIKRDSLTLLFADAQASFTQAYK